MYNLAAQGHFNKIYKENTGTGHAMVCTGFLNNIIQSRGDE